jgi:hypothetical protein
LALPLAAGTQSQAASQTEGQLPAKPSKPAEPAQQQLTGAQVQTGTSSGLTADARVQILLADHQFLRVASELKDLPPEEAQLYRGILANRDNDPKRSIALLQPLLDKVTTSGDAEHEKLLRKALAEDYLRDGDWANAVKQYRELESRLGSKLSQDEQDEIEMPLKLLPLAEANPPMTVDACDPFVMQVSRNPLGLTDVPVFVDARPHTFMLDPTAPFNLIARSLAREVGLKLSDNAATIHTLTGKSMQVHATVIPRFTVGGRLTFRNVTAFVFDDADYAFPKSHYQVQGVLGYPALMALGSLTISSDATLEIHPAKEAQRDATTNASADGARFFLDGDQVIVALGPKGDDGMYIVDAGGQQSYFTSRYYDEHVSEFAGQKAELWSVPSTAPMEPQPTYAAETLPLTVGSTKVQVHFIQVLTHPLGKSVFDDVYGVLGMDVLDQLRSYTFDYRTMRFSVKAE